MNDKQKKFMHLHVVDGRSLESISKEIGVPEKTLTEWAIELSDEMDNVMIDEIERLEEVHQLSPTLRMRYLAELYTRLRKELDHRDFSGLPTDKLYDILTDVAERFRRETDDFDSFWEDEIDDDYDLEED